MPHDEVKRSHDWWNSKWSQITSPGVMWDVGRVSPPLVSFVDKHKDSLPRGRVLVPGCGRGYAPVFFETCGLATELSLGLDVSDTALGHAETFAHTHVPNSKVTEFRKADFFALDAEQEGGQFDIIYDLTFLCAIDPEQRAAWGKQMKALLAPEGQLITLLYPGSTADDSPAENMMRARGLKGPPFVLQLDEVAALMKQSGLSLVEGTSVEGPCDDSVERRQGMEYIARWTHAGGDGQ